MYSSSELIEALRRRRRRSLRPERPAGEFPEGWSAWFETLRARPGRVVGATAASIIAIFLAREPRLPPAALAELGRWRAFASLWRQEWQPATPDQRGLRIFAMSASVLLHILFTAILAWLMYMRFLSVMGEEAPVGEDIVQVEFIGEGAPEDEGGGVQQGEEPREAASAKPIPPRPAAETMPPLSEVPPPAMAAQEQPEPEPPAPPAAQPLQVTETPTPDTRFVLPPPRPVDVATPAVEVPELTARRREIQVVEAPAAPRLRPLPEREIAVPDLQQQPTEVVAREIPAPLPQVPTQPRPQPRLAAPELSAEAPRANLREIPSPASSEGAPRSAASRTAGNAEASTGSRGGGQPEGTTGTRRDGPSAGSGLASTPNPGAPPGARRSDDWGDSTRNRPGGPAGSNTPGLFNPDGSPRLAGRDNKVGGGLPPGTITEDYEKIDRMGTWLKRPPIGFEPTAFDRFWVPHETLLEKWVRQSIKEVLIPIPGTSKTIKCAVALLALGGACAISDPNMKDIEATARKAPDVPFKPELQEDQESLEKPRSQP
ncbi:hypothetical protein [Luteimonas vadosa]|uniref:Transmembrane repetitive protein n=1 Tax=Luteimonas vadosa TaxID=1165507 RepID=A0ABP9E228_9GAMM